MAERTIADLEALLLRLEGKGYKAYKGVEGLYRAPTFTLFIDHVQGDPFAPPSRVRVQVEHRKAGFPPDTYSTKSRRIALADFLTRQFAAAAERVEEHLGTGHSGLIAIDRPGQEILERTSVVITEEYIEARFVVGLPARGRRILGKEAAELLCRKVPKVVEETLFFSKLDRRSLYLQILTAEDADWLRGQLPKRGLVAFVADGSILPRRSGIDDRPLPQEKAIPFRSPESLKVEFHLPNRGLIKGMGIPEGVTLIVGGGYHGKSTLLNAIQLGIYNHIPGDGREFVVIIPSAVKIRAEDGRRIEKVDISPFISNLPFGQDTTRFCTENASGSTSQAANIIEALEAGAKLLLLDEDTCATNFMVRDHRMQELISKDKEPITPFIDKVRQLYSEHGVSTILVMGGSGDYFDVADTVIAMIEYRPYDVTAEAKAIAEKYKAERKNEGGESFGQIKPRVPLAWSLDPSKGKYEVKITAKGTRAIVFGRHEIDLSAVEQLVHPGQLHAIGQALYYARERYMDGRRTVAEILKLVMEDIERGGLDVLDSRLMGHYAIFRPQELAAALNRLRTLKVKCNLSRRP
jgi:predicted ABC-class ATPase